MKHRQLTYRGVVYPWHCDHMGHMNVMWYVGKFDEATWVFFAGIGLTPATLGSADRGMAALEQKITYQHEAMPGDTLEIHTRALEIRAKTIRFAHEMTDCQTARVSATCEMVTVYLDTRTRKGVAFPDTLRERVQALI